MSIELYYIPDGENTDTILKLLKDGGYDFTAKDIIAHPELKAELEGMEGRVNIPTLVVNGKIYESVTPEIAKEALAKIDTDEGVAV